MFVVNNRVVSSYDLNFELYANRQFHCFGKYFLNFNNTIISLHVICFTYFIYTYNWILIFLQAAQKPFQQQLCALLFISD